MNLDKLQASLTAHEGRRKFPYTDSVGKLTVGIGHNLTDIGVSDAVINLMFSEDIKKTLDFLGTQPWWLKLDDVRQVAIADMTFDLMSKLLEFHGMIAALEAKDWNLAATHLLDSLFARQTGKRATDLAQMIRTGNYV